LLEGRFFFGFLGQLGLLVAKIGFVVTHELGFRFPLGVLGAQFLFQGALSSQGLPRFGLGALEQSRLRAHGDLELGDSQQVGSAHAAGGQALLLAADRLRRALGVIAARGFPLPQLGLGLVRPRHLPRQLSRQRVSPLVPHPAERLERILQPRHARYRTTGFRSCFACP